MTVHETHEQNSQTFCLCVTYGLNILYAISGEFVDISVSDWKIISVYVIIPSLLCCGSKVGLMSVMHTHLDGGNNAAKVTDQTLGVYGSPPGHPGSLSTKLITMCEWHVTLLGDCMSCDWSVQATWLFSYKFFECCEGDIKLNKVILSFSATQV